MRVCVCGCVCVCVCVGGCVCDGVFVCLSGGEVDDDKLTGLSLTFTISF